MQRYKVIAPLILATVEGKVHYVYAGGLVPLGADQDRIDDWLASKLIVEVDEGPTAPATAEEIRAALSRLGVSVSADDAAALLANASPVGDETGDGLVTSADSAGLPADAPKKTASRADWEAYAVSRGLSEEAVKAAPNKEALIETISAQAA
jgi:hypothetical protein